MRVLRRHLAALLPIVTLSTALSAQGSGGTGGFVVRRADAGATPAATHRELPAVAARALITAHHPEIAAGSVDPAIVTFVLDNGSNYVASAVSKPAVVVQSPDGSVAAAGGFVSATPVTATPVIVARESGGSASATAGDGSTPHATMTIAGIGPIDGATVEETFWTNYAAGEIGPVAVRVRYVILKATK